MLHVAYGNGNYQSILKFLFAGDFDATIFTVLNS